MTMEYDGVIKQSGTNGTLEDIMIQTLEEALERIKVLETENEKLREEVAALQSRKIGGRKKHDEAWMASYHDFVEKFESGMKIMEIVNEGAISRRTAYRYKAYYDELKKTGERENERE